METISHRDSNLITSINDDDVPLQTLVLEEIVSTQLTRVVPFSQSQVKTWRASSTLSLVVVALIRHQWSGKTISSFHSNRLVRIIWLDRDSFIHCEDVCVVEHANESFVLSTTSAFLSLSFFWWGIFLSSSNYYFTRLSYISVISMKRKKRSRHQRSILFASIPSRQKTDECLLTAGSNELQKIQSGGNQSENEE